ncbi:MAG: hypothetical protein A3I01_12735 [Betaproteobacteria bacterium RIFCSPLOWO2_02_FULL_65_24]|nr:MAG: hypothetical protein A3I01_12735 [Betaproteobacteria bacterium RIFCSPLOWO2_02_FULL_65_24]
MGRSSLDRTGEQRPREGRSRGTGALGPGDTSDSGSDVRGGRDLGGHSDDAGLDASLDSDAGRTAERAAIGQNPDELPRDIAPERGAASPGPAGGESGGRDFSNRRPSRGNRLRRGLRSRRKSYRQR